MPAPLLIAAVPLIAATPALVRAAPIVAARCAPVLAQANAVATRIAPAATRFIGQTVGVEYVGSGVANGFRFATSLPAHAAAAKKSVETLTLDQLPIIRRP